MFVAVYPSLALSDNEEETKSRVVEKQDESWNPGGMSCQCRVVVRNPGGVSCHCRVIVRNPGGMSSESVGYVTVPWLYV